MINFLSYICPKYLATFGAILESTFLKKKLLWLLLGAFFGGENWATFSQHLVTLDSVGTVGFPLMRHFWPFKRPKEQGPMSSTNSCLR